MLDSSFRRWSLGSTLFLPLLALAVCACSDPASQDPEANAGEPGTGGSSGSGTGGASTGGAGSGAGGSATSGAGAGGAAGGSAGSGGPAGSGGLGGSAGGTGAVGGAAGAAGSGAGAGGRGGTAGAGGGGGSGGIPAGCTAIELQAMQYDAANSNTNARLFRAPLQTSLGGTAIDGMTISIVSLDPADLSMTGTFALGVGVESNYSTCEHCIVVVQDSGAANAKRFFPVSGTMNIDPSTPPSNAATTGFQGSLVGVHLIEVTIAGSPSFTSTPVPNGDCLYVVNEPFDAP